MPVGKGGRGGLPAGIVLLVGAFLYALASRRTVVVFFY